MIEVVMEKFSATGEALANSFAPDSPDGYINWTGGKLNPTEFDSPVLNAFARTDKLFQLGTLQAKGVNVPPFQMEGWPRPVFPPGEKWLPRRRFHQQGKDFTKPPKKPDFWVKHLALEDEWRLHFFKTSRGNLRLLRSGLKLPKSTTAHPWVKSHRLGWKLSYLGGAPQSHVEEGRKAMEALGLDFGAVDISTTYSGKPVVLEVNTCPGLEDGTLKKYVDSILERLS